MPEEQTSPEARCAMVIVAHPDDAEFGSAGTVARWVREGKEVVYVLCTSGDKGTSDISQSPAALAEVRRVEQEAAARVLGVKQVVFLGYEDGLLTSTIELRRDLVRQIRRFKPDIVICPDPTSRWYAQQYLNHPDHRAAGDAALHKVREVYISTRENADLWVDISETIDAKIAALREHKSQIRDHHADVEKWVREGAQRAAEGQGMQYAETYKYIKLG